jgi:hypothetical protein
LHTTEAGALLLLWQAVISGVMAGAVVFFLSLTLRARDPWIWGGVTLFVVMGLAWGVSLRHWFNLTAERLTGIDLNRDGRIGEQKPPKTPEVRVRISGIDQETRHFRETVTNFHATADQMQKLAEGILDIEFPKRFTTREWCGDGKPFSINQFNNLRAEFLTAKTFDDKPLMIEKSEKGVNRGYEFTQEGREVLERFLPENMGE